MQLGALRWRRPLSAGVQYGHVAPRRVAVGARGESLVAGEARVTSHALGIYQPTGTHQVRGDLCGVSLFGSSMQPFDRVRDLEVEPKTSQLVSLVETGRQQ